MAGEFDTLQDKAIKQKALDVFHGVSDRIEASTDINEIRTIWENARQEIKDLYSGSESFDHDFSRFGLALSRILLNRAKEIENNSK